MKDRAMKFLGNMSSHNKTVVKNVIGAFGVKGLSLILTLFTMPAYIRYFQDQTVLGVWYTIISVLNWMIYFDLGLGNGLRNMLPEAITKKDTKRVRQYISTTYITMSILVIGLGILGLLVIPHVNWNHILNVAESIADQHTLKVCVLILFCSTLVQFVLKLVTSTLYALQRSALVNAMTLCTSLLTLCALYIIPSSTLRANLWRMAWVNVIAATLPYLVASFFVYGKMLNGAYPKLRFFRKEYVSPLLKMGVSLLWLQLIFMVVSSTNEFLISALTSPENVVLYQAYYKVFKTGSMVFSLALTPIWSAVTKAQAEKNYCWIIRIYKVFLIATAGCVVLEFLVIPFLQVFMNIWLGQGLIEVNSVYAVIFAISGSLFVLHNVNTSVSNGISYFKVQMILVTLAAALFIPLAYVCVRITNSWIGVVIAQVLALAPYEFMAPFFTMRKLRAAVNKQENTLMH